MLHVGVWICVHVHCVNVFRMVDTNLQVQGHVPVITQVQ